MSDGILVTLSDGTQEYLTDEEMEVAAEYLDRLRDLIDNDNYGYNKKGLTDDGHQETE